MFYGVLFKFPFSSLEFLFPALPRLLCKTKMPWSSAWPGPRARSSSANSGIPQSCSKSHPSHLHWNKNPPKAGGSGHPSQERLKISVLRKDRRGQTLPLSLFWGSCTNKYNVCRQDSDPEGTRFYLLFQQTEKHMQEKPTAWKYIMMCFLCLLFCGYSSHITKHLFWFFEQIFVLIFWESFIGGSSRTCQRRALGTHME